MCLMVYLGTVANLRSFCEVAVGQVGLDPDPANVPAALAEVPRVYRVCDRVPTGWNCSCIFLDQAMPWEDPDLAADDDADVRRAAYAQLRDIANTALAADPGTVLFSCWAGDEGKPPRITRDLAPADLLADRYHFDDMTDRGSGGNPPILIRFAPAEVPNV